MRQGNKTLTQKKDLSLTEWDRKLLAWHEAGHAVVSFFSSGQERIQRISIIPSDEAFGIMKTEPRKSHNMTLTSMLGSMSVALGGRLSEKIFLGEITSSCIYDLCNARDMALHMVCVLGIGQRTGIWVCAQPKDDDWVLLCEEQRRNVYLDVNELLLNAQKRAEDILNKHADAVKIVAEALLEKGVLDGNLFQNLIERMRYAK